jgi:hypothetical protein
VADYGPARFASGIWQAAEWARERGARPLSVASRTLMRALSARRVEE